MKVAIIGRTKAMLRTGELLISKGFQIPLVVTCKEAPEYDITAKDFEIFANRIGAKYINTAKINTPGVKQEIKSIGKIDIACSINYAGIISEEVINYFDLGILNSHAGDLPRYRGNAVLAWAIMNDEKETGLCIHSMIGGELDSGKIIERIYKKINHNTKVKELFDWVISATPELFLSAVEKLNNNPDFCLEHQSTDPKDILRCYPRIPEDGLINWQNSAKDILRLVNASGEPFMGAYTYLDDKQIIIDDVEVYDDDEVFSGIPGQIANRLESGCLTVLTGKGKLKIIKIRDGVNGVSKQPCEIIKSLRKRFNISPSI
jgi:methionyl-tRNA formyltransferase